MKLRCLLVVALFALAAPISVEAGRVKDYWDALACLRGVGAPDSIIRGCTRLLKRGNHKTSNDEAKAYNTRGRAHYRKGDYDRAIADYDQAIKLNPRYALFYNNRGNAYEKKKLRAKAIADYRVALGINPNSEWTRKALKRLGAEP